jgi:hypothetical protein
VNIKDLQSLPLTSYRQLPAISAVYFIVVDPDDVLYIGQARSLRHRWTQGHHRALDAIGNNPRIAWLPTELSKLAEVENDLLKLFRPPLNNRAPQAQPARLIVRKCKLCSHEWAQRGKGIPKACPRCKRYDYDKAQTTRGNNES